MRVKLPSKHGRFTHLYIASCYAPHSAPPHFLNSLTPYSPGAPALLPEFPEIPCPPGFRFVLRVQSSDPSTQIPQVNSYLDSFPSINSILSSQYGPQK